MYCSHCGKQIPDDSNYCLNCGMPQRADVAPRNSKYEICEIVWECVKINILSDHKLRFWAKATGEDGNYRAGESNVFDHFAREIDEYDAETSRVVAAHDNLVKLLVADGWERTEAQGKEWYSFRFRRPMKSVVRP